MKNYLIAAFDKGFLVRSLRGQEEIKKNDISSPICVFCKNGVLYHVFNIYHCLFSFDRNIQRCTLKLLIILNVYFRKIII